MSPDSVITFLTIFFPWGFIKLSIVVVLFIYMMFAAVVVRQEQLMSRVVEIPYAPVFKLVALGHFFASLVILVLALVIV